MRVLIISTLYSGGGAEIQSKFEFDLLKNKGNDVRYITFDPDIETGVSLCDGHINLLGGYSKNSRRLYDVIRNREVEKKMYSYLRNFAPDVIHLHQIVFAVKSIYYVVKNFPTIQTVHDYSVVCDKGTCILYDGRVCPNGETVECYKRCFCESFRSRLKYVYRRFVRNGIHGYRKKYVDMFISPSECLAKYLREKKYNAVCINNAIDIGEYFSFKKNLTAGRKKVLYYGAIRKAKGVQQLIDAYEPKEMPNIELHLIGGFDKGRREDCYSEEELMKKISEKKIVYHGRMEHQKIFVFLQDVFAVIVPSFGMENYPTTAIEGICGECIVAGSDRGGVPELIAEKDMIFDVTNRESIKMCLKKIDCMTEEEYENICRKQSELFERNNTPDIYIKRLMNTIEEVIAKHEGK